MFGYTVFNDVGARSIQFHNGQRDLGKNFDTFCPMGPCIVTRDELPDWEAIRIRSPSTASCGRTPSSASSSARPGGDRVAFIDHHASSRATA